MLLTCSGIPLFYSNEPCKLIWLLRPVIQGTADVGKKLTDDELDKTMDFCQRERLDVDYDCAPDHSNPQTFLLRSIMT